MKLLQWWITILDPLSKSEAAIVIILAVLIVLALLVLWRLVLALLNDEPPPGWTREAPPSRRDASAPRSIVIVEVRGHHARLSCGHRFTQGVHAGRPTLGAPAYCPICRRGNEAHAS